MTGTPGKATDSKFASDGSQMEIVSGYTTLTIPYHLLINWADKLEAIQRMNFAPAVQDAPEPDCQHDWFDATNDKVENAMWCPGCNEIRTMDESQLSTIDLESRLLKYPRVNWKV